VDVLSRKIDAHYRTVYVHQKEILGVESDYLIGIQNMHESSEHLARDLTELGQALHGACEVDK